MSESPSLVLLEAAPGPDNPIGMLMACHRRLEARLETLTRVVEVYQQRDEERYDQAAGAIGLVVRHLRGPARLHHEDEELSLVPRLAHQDAVVAQQLAALEREHELLDARWAAVLPGLLQLAGGAEPTDELVAEVAKGVASLRKGYAAHIQREDEVIYPAAKRILDAEDLAEVGVEMASRRHVV